METIYQDIPRFYTALAEWGACVIYICLIKKRFNNKITVALSTLFLVAQIALLVPTGDLPTVWWIPCMVSAAFLMYLFIYTVGNVHSITAAYLCARAFLIAEFTASFQWQLDCYLNARVDVEHFVFAKIVMLVVIYTAIFVLVAFMEKPLMNPEYLNKITYKEFIAVIAIVAVAFTFSNLSFIWKNTPFSSGFRSDIFNIRTLFDLAGMTILYAYQSRVCELMAESEIVTMDSMLKSQYNQYRNYQESIDLINMKYHDLKHQIAGLRAETDIDKRTEWLDAMEDDIRGFESVTNTGNKVLDTIIAGKIMHGQKYDIKFTCVIDGKLLEFMHVTDICTIFGNAIDNAIENVVMIKDIEKRIIHVTVSAKNKFVLIQFQNYCEVKPNEDKRGIRLFESSKADKRNHGFGLKSIQYTVDKYDGTMKAGMNKDWFELTILIPCSNK
ncbi:sensor histidine kinase [Eubacterium sp. AF19-12LB]|uniref:ATP-binding protein n=1 Tax=Eubacterium sp. AF19-12LB TaxID=2293106 RepID=UPI000E46C6CA|nr:sensor histidine kinase [Eubacterium sp. AF19-12LB]RHR34586.1 ATP-binding protein [Eubacterium sp. AF19-12LB]